MQLLTNLKRLFPDKIKVFIKKSFTKNEFRLIESSIPISVCLCCGSTSILYKPILWDKLIQYWQLSDYEVAYINRQQGIRCRRCKVRLRGMAIAYGMMKYENYNGLFKDFVKKRKIQKKKILEINEAGWLTQYFNQIPGHVLAKYPEVDMQKMPYTDNSFDVVVHSDTLEHVNDPLAALKECQRVLVPGGFCIFTIPMVIDRLTKSRSGLPPSYHGSKLETGDDYVVHTEYGSDAWRFAFDSGFSEVRIYSVEYPAAQSLLFKK